MTSVGPLGTLASWETGSGGVAIRVSVLPANVPAPQHCVLAAELTGLSEALRRCYTHPASAADNLDVNTEAAARADPERVRVGGHHIRRPNLPDDHGSLLVSYDPVDERTHRVGRCLHRAAEAGLSAVVSVEVEAELAAVERAELGDGRRV